MQLQFNAQGYLEPFEAIVAELTTAKEFLTWNEHRKSLWQNFEAFINELQNILQTNFTIWLNGSFVTQKEIPNDIDIVVFVDYQTFDIYEKILSKFKEPRFRKFQKLDVYFVRIYPETHRKKVFEEFDRAEWFFLFSRNRNKERKGFLEIKF